MGLGLPVESHRKFGVTGVFAYVEEAVCRRIEPCLLVRSRLLLPIGGSSLWLQPPSIAKSSRDVAPWLILFTKSDNGLMDNDA